MKSQSIELEVAEAYVTEAEHLLQRSSGFSDDERHRRERYLEKSRALVKIIKEKAPEECTIPVRR